MRKLTNFSGVRLATIWHRRHALHERQAIWLRRQALSDLHGCAELTGPEDTPYAGGVFLVEVSAPAR